MQWTRLVTTHLEGWNHQVDKDWYVDLRPEIGKYRGIIWIPEGFVTDLSSIPPRLRSFVTRKDTEYAGVVHDYGCRNKHLRLIKTTKRIQYSRVSLAPDTPYEPVQVSRKEIDKIFRKMLIASNVSRWKAWLMWSAVRVSSIF